MAKSWTDVNEMLEIIFSNETAALVDEGGNSSNKNHDSDKGLIGNASGNSSESAESNWEYEEDLPRPSHHHHHSFNVSVPLKVGRTVMHTKNILPFQIPVKLHPKRRKYGSNDITADNNNDNNNNNNNELILSSSPVGTSVNAGTASDFSETMHNCVQNTSTLANFSDIGDTSNELLPSFSDSGLESVGTSQ